MNKNYHNKNLDQKIFKNMNLKEISFLKSSISRANFINCNVEKCELWESKLSHTKFTNTKFKDCVFTDADLSRASFVNSSIIRSNLSHTDLRNVNFKTSKLIKINLRDAIFNDKTRWPKNFNPLSFGAIKYKLNKKKVKKKLSKLEKKIIHELTAGKGYYVVKNYFSKKKVNKAFKIILKKINEDKVWRKKYKNFSRDKKINQFYVYKNLMGLDKIFVELIQPKIAMNVFKILLGEKFICSFFGVNCLFPGARGQLPHCDYPYLDIAKPGEKLPFDLDISGHIGKRILLNCQVVVPLVDFNYDNGSTGIRPGSQRYCKFPQEEEFKKGKFEQHKIKAGSVIIFNGLLWHGAMPNYTHDQYRFATLGGYVPHFIKPALDLQSITKNKKVITNDKGYLQQLLGVNLVFPGKGMTPGKYGKYAKTNPAPYMKEHYK